MIIILISTQSVDADNLRVPLAPDEGNGLTQQSYVMIEKLLAHPRRLFGAKIGSISQEDMARVEQAVATILGLCPLDHSLSPSPCFLMQWRNWS